MQLIQGLGLEAVLTELRWLRQARPKARSTSDHNAPDVSAAAVAQLFLTGRFLLGDPAPPGSPQRLDSFQEEGVGASPPASASSVHWPGQVKSAVLSGSGRLYWQSVARVGVQVADALAYANGQGILHRDIKPSNLLLDTHGTVWVTDFGLAKAVGSEDLTHSGDVVGTLRYLAPERFQGRADARGDIYALGLTLYELVTLRPAFVENDRNKLIAQVLHAEPPRPRQLSPEVPRDLETIVLKAMDRDPARRYPTASELADDLRRFVEGEPIRARRVQAWQRAVLWARRRPAVAALLLVSGLAALALVGVAVALRYNAWLQEAYREVRIHQYAHFIDRAHAALRDGNMGQVERLLEACPVEQRHWEWHYLKRQCHAELLTLGPELLTLQVQSGGIAFSPDGTRLAAGSPEGTVKILDATSGPPRLS
jgi:hypothetical protein